MLMCDMCVRCVRVSILMCMRCVRVSMLMCDMSMRCVRVSMHISTALHYF